MLCPVERKTIELNSLEGAGKTVRAKMRKIAGMLYSTLTRRRLTVRNVKKSETLIALSLFSWRLVFSPRLGGKLQHCQGFWRQKKTHTHQQQSTRAGNIATQWEQSNNNQKSSPNRPVLLCRALVVLLPGLCSLWTQRESFLEGPRRM